MVRLSTIQGRVVTEDGALDPELGPIDVRIVGSVYGRKNSAGSDGNFSFRDEWPDEYRIVAKPRSDSPYVDTWLGNTTDPESAETVTLREGDHLYGLEIRLSRR